MSKSRIWICWRLFQLAFGGSLGRGLNAGLVFSIAALLLVSSALAQGDCKCDASATTADAGPFGSLLDGPEFQAAVQALPPAAFFSTPVQPPLPSHAFLANLPAVSQQGTAENIGSPGTCEAQSFGYGLGSYTAARHSDGSPKWNPALAQNSVSAAYLYALQRTKQGGTCPTGTLALPYLEQLVKFGAPTRARVPYPELATTEADCDYLNTIQEQTDFPDNYPAMQRFQIGSYAIFHIEDNSQAVSLTKEYIANGQAVAFSGSVLCGYCTPVPLQNGVIYETEYKAGSGHGQLVVGYDDDIGVPDKKGALLIQNSFGTAWPPASSQSPAPPGMVYWSYNSFEKTQKLAAVAYPRSPGPPAGVRLSRSQHAPQASVTRAFQWAPNSPQGVYLILTHFFHDPVLLDSVVLTEPGGPNRVTATAAYGQYISTGYSYLTRKDGNAFLSGTWAVTLEGRNVSGNPITYTGAVVVGAPQPNILTSASMAGQEITGSTGADATLTP